MDVLAPAWGRSAGIHHGSSREFMEDWGVSNARFLCWSDWKDHERPPGPTGCGMLWHVSKSNWPSKIGDLWRFTGQTSKSTAGSDLKTSPVSVAKFHPRLLGRGVFTQQAAEFSMHWTIGKQHRDELYGYAHGVKELMLDSPYLGVYIEIHTYIYIYKLIYNWSKSYKLIQIVVCYFSSHGVYKVTTVPSIAPAVFRQFWCF